MKIALIGYGKMGKAIEQIAIAQGHEIVLKISSSNYHDFTEEHIKKADVAIEFSTPETCFDNVKKCLQHHIPVVCGTTAWLQHLEEAKNFATQHNTGFLFASNFSIGVAIFFKLNKYVASLLHKYPQYQVSMEEIHHTAKKDSPSGTAVTLAEGILESYTEKTTWVNEVSSQAHELSIISKRIDPAPGTHTIQYESPIDTISLTHTAHSRIGFASGAVLAAEFLSSRKGIYTMNDVLDL